MKLVATIAKWLAILVYAACAVVIVASVLPIGGWKALDVLTGSMRPGIQPGDLVIIRHVALPDIHPGDIVTYTNPINPKQTITHRVVSLPVKNGLQMVITKGDANPTADPEFAGGHIIGKVGMHIPFVGKLANAIHSPIGLLSLIIIPGILVILGEVQTLRRALARPQSSQNNQESDPPDFQPPSDPPSRIQAAPRRSTRRMDGMGPRTMGIALMAIAAMSVGFTYAKTTTNPVKAEGKVVVLAVPTSADDCKNGGWQQYKNPDGSPRFKNQGDCVSFVNSNSHSHSTVANITNVTVINESTQDAHTGNVSATGNTSGPASSGGASNTNSTTTSAAVQ